VKLWLSVPNHVIEAESVNSFNNKPDNLIAHFVYCTGCEHTGGLRRTPPMPILSSRTTKRWEYPYVFLFPFRL